MCLNQSGAPNMSCKSVILPYILILCAVLALNGLQTICVILYAN